MEKIRESLSSVLPITAIVLLLSITIAPLTPGAMVLFFFGALLLIVGTGIFTLGVDMSMTPMGSGMGIYMSQSRRKWLTLGAAFVLGLLVTIAEPDLQVLATQVPAIPNLTLILTVAVGVGLFLVLALVRILLKIPLSRLLVIFYILVFLLAILAPNDFIPVAFDSGGVTTGPITVPFIMALGVGLATIRSDKNSTSDSFGLVALCSIGPVLSVLILGMIYRSGDASYTPLSVSAIEDTRALLAAFGAAAPEYAKEVALALGPILAFFLVFQVLFFRLRRRALAKILVGILYTFLGLTLFLTGVNVGFMPAGNELGRRLAGLPLRWLIVPVGMLIGYFLVKAEPAVLVLNKQVEEITGGAISQKVMMAGLSIGMAASVGLSMVRVLTGAPLLWFLLPGYALALALSFFVPRIFTAVAFDSGGVASGPMTATFLLPFAMGACEAVGGDILTDAFGVVAMVAMIPLITIQIIGLVYQFKTRHAAGESAPAQEADDVLELDAGPEEDVQ